MGSLKSFSWQFLGIRQSLWRSFMESLHVHTTPETNGIAERAVCRIKESTFVVLLQSGLNESWWANSMECYTYLRNVTDLLSDGKTLYERRFGQPFEGPIIPFGSWVEYHPITAKDQSRIHRFGKKVLPGLFFGYSLYAGGIWKWRRRKKNHSLFHWSILTSPELLIRIWMSSWKSASMIIGILMALETCLILGQVSHNLLYWM